MIKLSFSAQPLWHFQRPAHRPRFIRLRTTATQNRSLIWRHLPMGTQRRRPHPRTRHRRSMQPRFIHHRQSTWCQLPSTRLRWCRAITQRPWFRSQYMPTRPGIRVATGMGGAATITGIRSQYMPTRPGIRVATGMAGAATITGMGGAKHLTRNEVTTIGRPSRLTAVAPEPLVFTETGATLIRVLRQPCLS